MFSWKRSAVIIGTVARPAASVIIPTYNCAELLPQAVRSVLDQDVGDDRVEIIVVDDGSADAARATLAQFGDDVTYVRQENAGAAAARNRGVALSHGEYVTFLDADDYWLPGCLAAMLALAREHSRALVTIDFYYETDGVRDEQSIFAKNDQYSFFDLPADDQYPRALDAGLFSVMTMIPRAVFDEFGGFNAGLRFAEDYDLWLRCLSRGIPVRAVKRPVAVYRYRRPGPTKRGRPTSDRIAALLRMLEPHRQYVSQHRWRTLQNSLAYCRFCEALRDRSWISIVNNGMRLATRPRFCLEIIRGRQAGA
jgi:glycosyltransferase involved in cell wall biosynthesis